MKWKSLFLLHVNLMFTLTSSRPQNTLKRPSSSPVVSLHCSLLHSSTFYSFCYPADACDVDVHFICYELLLFHFYCWYLTYFIMIVVRAIATRRQIATFSTFFLTHSKMAEFGSFVRENILFESSTQSTQLTRNLLLLIVFQEKSFHCHPIICDIKFHFASSLEKS